MKTTRIALILFATALVASCVSRSGLGAINVSHAYQMDGVIIHPDVRVFHTSNYDTDVYFRINSTDLLYIRPQSDLPFEAKLTVTAFVYRSFKQENLVDSTKIELTDRMDELSSKYLSGVLHIEIPDRQPQEAYVMLLRFHDVNRKLYFEEVNLIHRANPLHRQNFLLTDLDSNVVFNDYVQLHTPHRIFYNTDIDELNVRYYDREFALATPPFVDDSPPQFDYVADSTFTIDNGGEFALHDRGFYHFQADPSTHDGFSVYHFYKSYPYVTQKEQLIGPMRFVTSNLEFQGMDLSSPDSAKIAIDAFWLRHAGTEERARDQVEEYYSRVEKANQLFSCYKQGWRTDRGILYVVYGPPSGIYRTLDTETWVYGEEASSLNYTFVFDRMINPFSGNDYQLRRQSDYRYGWGLSIEAWRHGRIYDVEDIKRAQDERDQQLRQTAPPYIWY